MRALLAIWLELWTPSSRDERPYLWALIAIAHAALGAAAADMVALVLGHPSWTAGLLLLVIYGTLKERSDLRRGGSLLDSLVDILFVGLGLASLMIPVFDLLLLALVGVGVVVRPWLERAMR